MAPPEDDHSGENQGEQPTPSKGEIGPVREDATGTSLQTTEIAGKTLEAPTNRH